MIPSLPPKVFKGTTDVTEQHFTAARSRGLLAFLKATGNHPDLRNSKHLFLFVEASDAKFKGARDIATAQEETSTLLADKAWGWFGKAKEALKENETFKDLADKAGVQVLGGTGEDEKVVTAEDSEVAELVEFITQLEANLRMLQLSSGNLIHLKEPLAEKLMEFSLSIGELGGVDELTEGIGCDKISKFAALQASQAARCMRSFYHRLETIVLQAGTAKEALQARTERRLALQASNREVARLQVGDSGLE